MIRFLRPLAVCAALVGAVMSFERLAQAQFVRPRPIIPNRPREPYHPHLHDHPPLHPPLHFGPNPSFHPPQLDMPLQLPSVPSVQLGGYPVYQGGQRGDDRRAAVIRAVQQQLASSPRQGLDALLEQRDRLLPEDRIALVQQIIAILGAQIDETADPWQARRLVQEMEERFRREKLSSGGLSALRALVNQRCLDERLVEVAAHLLAGNIQEAGRLVEKVLSELTGAKVGAENVNFAEFGKGGILAGNVVRLNRELETLRQLEAALKGAGLERRARLLRLNTSNAPESVARPLNDLRELESLRTVLAQPGKAPLHAVARIEAILAAVARTADGEPAVTRLRQDISARLLLEGRAGEARKVLAGGPPGADSREHAAALLRDLKACALGEGKVSTVAVADAVAPVGPGTGAGPRGPSSFRDLASRGKARAWKPPARALPLADLGPVANAERLESKLEARLEAEVRQAPKNSLEQARSLARQIETHLRSAHPPARSGPKASSKTLADR